MVILSSSSATSISTTLKTPTFSHRSVKHTHFSRVPLLCSSPSAARCFISRKLQLSSSSTAVTAIPFDLSPPPIDHDLYDDLAISVENISEAWVIETYDNDEEALDAVDNGTVIVDLSHYGRIRVSGEDRIHFLHNQSTANFEALSKGGGCDTVFVTPTARTIDIALAWNMKTAVTLVVSPSTSGSISEMLRKYIFFADKVEIQDISDKTCLFALLGPKSNQVMVDLNLGDLMGRPYGSHKHYNVGGNPVTVAVGSVISEEGFSLLMSPAAAGMIWKALLNNGATPMGSNALETYRILQGRPTPGRELTDEFNVLEAGLWNAVSLNKGCYKGQETIARLITYDGIKQKLCGIQLSSAVEPGSPITVEGKKVGKLTSYTCGKGGNEHFGLGYIKKKATSKGDTVVVGDGISGIVVDVPYLARQQPLVPTSKP
uniref:putative transferase At1g60990, chloroplastic n=1 Tax=Erigeron canadensis TaxID=72917 RepID=UPI001CB9417E|nr:putative transferase At1g60990, chloroplastic [Erigeron canadensis]